LQPEIDELHRAALLHRRRGDLLAAQTACSAILARDPRHVGALIIMGGTSQELGRNNAAIKFLRQAIALDERNARAHDNLAMTYQALGRHDEAVAEFGRAIELGLRDIEPLVKQCPAISAPMSRLAMAWPRRLPLAEIFGPDGLGAIAGEGLLIALLQCRPVCDLELERLLVAVRSAVLQAVMSDRREGLDEGMRFFSAIALQCFINEYIYPLSDAEREQADRLRDRLIETFGTHATVAPLDLTVAAMYRPLHTLPFAAALLATPQLAAVEPLLRQQIREPQEEASYRDSMPVLTAADDSASLENEMQFDENPYPRWFTRAPVRPTTLDDYVQAKLGRRPYRNSQE
jgi:tetratricopeptide (TPR) repeat protein